jgi:thioredoxin 2
MAPHFAAAAAQLEPQAVLLKLDSQAEPHAAADFGVGGIPTLVLLHNGQEIARHAGAMSRQSLIAWTRAALADQPPIA